jgi:CRP/FNR family cyclic AMP-dependent transcriptional regulator
MSISPDALASVPLLAGLNRRGLKSLADQMRDRQVTAGQAVVEQGTSGVGFFVILEGEAEVQVDGEPRRTLGPGDHFGEIALVVPDAVRSATVVATTDMRLAGLTSWQFRPFVLEQPEIAWTLLETLARRVADTPGA